MTGLALLAGHWLLKCVKLAARPEACKAFHFLLPHHIELYMCVATGEDGLCMMSGLMGVFLTYHSVSGGLWCALEAQTHFDTPEASLSSLQSPLSCQLLGPHLFPADQLLAAQSLQVSLQKLLP